MPSGTLSYQNELNANNATFIHDDTYGLGKVCLLYTSIGPPPVREGFHDGDSVFRQRVDTPVAQFLLLGDGQAGIVDIDRHNLGRPKQTGALHRAKAHRPGSQYRYGIPRLDLA